jgi:hypothetical protein
MDRPVDAEGRSVLGLRRERAIIVVPASQFLREYSHLHRRESSDELSETLKLNPSKKTAMKDCIPEVLAVWVHPIGVGVLRITRCDVSSRVKWSNII